MEDERSSSSDGFEGSGWTMYFEDFYATTNNNLQIENGDNHHDDHDRHDQHCMRASLISDAASLVVKNSSSSCDLHREEPLGLPILGRSQCCPSRLSFKKRRTRGGVVDHALEDTASSPVHNPKVDDLLSQSQKNTRHQDKIDIFHQEKGNCSNQIIEEISGMGFKERKDTDTTELKKRGLFLVQYRWL